MACEYLLRGHADYILDIKQAWNVLRVIYHQTKLELHELNKMLNVKK